MGSSDVGFRSKYGLVAEWIHFALFGIILPTIKLNVCTFGGLCTQQQDRSTIVSKAFCVIESSGVFEDAHLDPPGVDPLIHNTLLGV